MKFETSLRHDYVEMVRMHRSELAAEWHRIESQKNDLLKSYASKRHSSWTGLMMKTYLLLKAYIEIYQFEAREGRRLQELRNKQELELYQLKTNLLPVDF